VEVGDPPFAAINETNIVDMAVADEGIAIEAHTIGLQNPVFTDRYARARRSQMNYRV
jgi:hypothetical protein